MELSETQIIIVLMVLGLLVAVINILVAIFVPIYLHRKTSTREKKISAPILRIPRYGVPDFPSFYFRLKNYGETSAEIIEVSYNKTLLGNFNIYPEKTTLAPQEEGSFSFNWCPHKTPLRTYKGELKVTVNYKSDFAKLETEEFTFLFDNGRLRLL